MIVVDTCVIIWDALAPDKLSPRAKSAIQKADKNYELLICDISLWEIALLIKKKRIRVDDSPANLLRLTLNSRDYTVVAISPEIADLAVNLNPEINGDPADRLIVATSILKQAPLVTPDNNLLEAKMVKTIW